MEFSELSPVEELAHLLNLRVLGTWSRTTAWVLPREMVWVAREDEVLRYGYRGEDGEVGDSRSTDGARRMQGAASADRMAVGDGEVWGDITGSGIRFVERRENSGVGYLGQSRSGYILKTLKIEGGTHAIHLERFRHEALCLKRLAGRGAPLLLHYGRHGEFLYLLTRALHAPPLTDTINLIAHYANIFNLERLVTGLDRVVSHLQREEIIHLDIKPANLLYDHELGEMQAIDFGAAVSSWLPSFCFPEYHYTGSPAYSAPEHLLRREVSYKSDIYSIGMILRRCLTGRLPGFMNDRESAREYYRHSAIPALRPGDVLPHLRGRVELSVLSWVNQLTSHDPDHRPLRVVHPEAW